MGNAETPLHGQPATTSPLGFLDIGQARVDTDRERRCGHPEVIYGESKTPEQIVSIARVLLAEHGLALATRVSANVAESVMEQIENGEYDSVARTLRFGAVRQQRDNVRVAVVSAGTSDLPVAEEAVVTLETFGAGVDRVVDVGVAGLHRLLASRGTIESALVIIVVAGMEGALPSVIAGLFRGPIIGVPTSVGYGAALGGLTPLMAMLTSCASGIMVVNIDNGFGAAMAALSILDRIAERG